MAITVRIHESVPPESQIPDWWQFGGSVYVTSSERGKPLITWVESAPEQLGYVVLDWDSNVPYTTSDRVWQFLVLTQVVMTDRIANGSICQLVMGSVFWRILQENVNVFVLSKIPDAFHRSVGIHGVIDDSIGTHVGELRNGEGSVISRHIWGDGYTERPTSGPGSLVNFTTQGVSHVRDV